MKASEFLNMIESTFQSNDFEGDEQLYRSIAGANYHLCQLSFEQWIRSLATADDDWFKMWPFSNYSKGVVETLFLGPLDHGVLKRRFHTYRLLRLPKYFPDRSLKGRSLHVDLVGLVTEDLKRRDIIFVTNWDALGVDDCCVTHAIEMLGLGNEQVPAGEERIVAELEVAGKLHRPTWIDSGFWLFWMYNLSDEDGFGYTRNLKTGEKGVQEWVCDPRHVAVKEARLIHASREGNFACAQLPEEYWTGTRNWLKASRQRVNSDQ